MLATHLIISTHLKNQVLDSGWSLDHTGAQTRATHKPITRVNTPTPFSLGNLNNTVSIQVGRDRAQIKRKRCAQRMLRPAIRICVKSRNADSMLRSSPPNTPSKLISPTSSQFKTQSFRSLFHTYSAISPRFAIKIESRVLLPCDVPATEDAALVVLRAAVGATRGVMRRRDESVMADDVSSEVVCLAAG